MESAAQEVFALVLVVHGARGASFAYLFSVYHRLKPRILCIDDEPEVGHLIRSWFEGRGEFHVAVETNALNAIRRSRLFRPDLLVLDIKMPEHDGLAIAREIRCEPWLRHRPILFYTGVLNAQESSLHAGAGGPTQFIQKATPLREVEKIVRSLLAERIEFYRKSVPPGMAEHDEELEPSE